jgi:hypothetical protein
MVGPMGTVMKGRHFGGVEQRVLSLQPEAMLVRRLLRFPQQRRTLAHPRLEAHLPQRGEQGCEEAPLPQRVAHNRGRRWWHLHGSSPAAGRRA